MLCADDIADVDRYCYQAHDVCYLTEKKSLDLSGARAYCNDLAQTRNIEMTLPVPHNPGAAESVKAYSYDATDEFWIDAESQQAPPSAPWIWIDETETVDPSSLYYVPFNQRCSL